MNEINGLQSDQRAVCCGKLFEVFRLLQDAQYETTPTEHSVQMEGTGHFHETVASPNLVIRRTEVIPGLAFG